MLVHTCPGQNSPMIFPTLSPAQARKEDKTFARFVTCQTLVPSQEVCWELSAKPLSRVLGVPSASLGPSLGVGIRMGLRRSPGGRGSYWRDRGLGETCASESKRESERLAKAAQP